MFPFVESLWVANIILLCNRQNQLPHEKKPARMKVISSQLVRELGLGDQVALCTPVVNIATGEIFFNSYRDNRIHVFDLEFRLKYSFNFETG